MDQNRNTLALNYRKNVFTCIYIHICLSTRVYKHTYIEVDISCNSNVILIYDTSIKIL